MILAAGLTPALQQILVFDHLTPGQVNRAREAHICASGKVLNVGLAIHHLGGPGMTLALVGGIAGISIDQEFTSMGIAHRWVWAKAGTRMCTTILERSTGVTTELVENARPVESSEVDDFLRSYEEILPQARIVVLSGSLPTGTPSAFYRDLIKQARVPVVLDASGMELLDALSAKPFCVKPNRDELGRTVGRELRSEEELKAAIHEVRHLGAQHVLVSNGAEPLFAGSKDGIFEFPTAKVSAVNPIGSGDCLAAGFAWGIDNGMDFTGAVSLGIAAAAENASMLLPARIDAERVRLRARDIHFLRIA